LKAIVLLKTVEPLNFRSSRSTSNSETLDYIPGTSILGGFANAHLKLRDDKKDEFADFFLNDKIRFGNLYPANLGGQENQLNNVNELPVKPLPATARTCKRFGGFRFNSKKEERHGVTDHLIIWALFALSGQKKVEMLNQNRNCKYQLKHGLCNESLARFNGFYQQRKNKNQLAQTKVEKRMLTRTGISRETGTIQRTILYNREVINEGQKFCGTFYFDSDELFEKFADFAKDVSNSKMLRLGNNKTRGLGLVEIKIDGIDEELECSYKDLLERVESFDCRLRKKADGYIELPHKLYFSISLQSDAIIRDLFLRYRTQIDEEYLHKTCNLENTELIYHSAGIRRVMGWNALWGLPDECKQAITMGSVFLFGYNGEVDESFYKQLFEIENNGIGSYRSQGFGEVTIADRFHWEVDDYANENN